MLVSNITELLNLTPSTLYRATEDKLPSTIELFIVSAMMLIAWLLLGYFPIWVSIRLKINSENRKHK